MAGPITWRNVTGGGEGQSTAARGFAQAGNTIGGAFDAFNKIIAGIEGTDAANALAREEVQKQNFLDSLQGAATPEQLAALSPALQAERALLSAPARAATRNAEEARLTSLRQQETAGNAYLDQKLDRENAPIVDQIGVLAAKGDVTGASALIQANPQLRKQAELMKAVVGGERDLKRFGFEEAREGRSAAADARQAEQHRMNQAVGALDLDEKRFNAQERTQLRSFDQTLAEESAAYQAATGESKLVIGNVANRLGLKVNGDGTPAYNSYEDADKARLNAALIAEGKPTLDTITAGDTAAAANAKQRLLQAGATQAQLATLLPRIASAFNTTPMAEIGNDAAATARKSAIDDAAADEARARLGVVSTPETIKGLREAAQPLLDRLAGDPKSYRAESYRRQLATFLDEDGIEAKDPVTGKITRVLPSPERLAIIVDKVNSTRWLGPASPYGDDITDELKKWKNSDEAKDAAREAIKTDATRRFKDVLKKSKE